MSFYDNLIKLAYEPEDVYIKKLKEVYGPKIKLGEDTQKAMHRINLSFHVEKAFPELNFFEVNMKTKLILDDDSIDTLKRLREIEEYCKKNPEIPHSQVFNRIMSNKKLKLVKK